MKKFLTITLILIMVLLSSVATVNAATKDDLIAAVSKTYIIAGKKIGLSNSDLVKVKRYISENEISSENGDKIITKINEAVSLMNKEGVSAPTKLSKAKKEELLNIAKEAVSLAGASLTYDANNKAISIYKDGKLYDSIALTSNYKFTQSGSNHMIYIIIGTVAVIAIAGVVGYRKTRANV